MRGDVEVLGQSGRYQAGGSLVRQFLLVIEVPRDSGRTWVWVMRT